MIKKRTLKNRSLIKKKNINDCPKCGGRCVSISEIHPCPSLKCEKCGQLIVNENYDISFVGYH